MMAWDDDGYVNNHFMSVNLTTFSLSEILNYLIELPEFGTKAFLKPWAYPINLIHKTKYVM